MPWTASDAKEHTKEADTETKQEKWAKVANNARTQCMKDGGDAEECDARAIRIANAAVKEADMLYKAYTMSTNNVLIPINAVDVGGEPVPVAELVAAYEEQRGQGQGQGNERQGDGGADMCICPECGRKFEHERGTPCNEMECPDCGVALTGKSKAEEVGEQDDKEGWQLTKSDITELIGIIDAELKRRKAKKEGETKEVEEMEPVSGDMPLEKLVAALFKSCPSRVGKSKSEWKTSVRSWVKGAATKSLTGYRRRLTMVGAKMGESEEVDIGKIRGLLQEALAMLDAQSEIAEVELAESAAGHAIGLEEAGKVADGPRAPLMMEVALIKPGFGNRKDNHYYPPDVLRRDIHVFEGVKMYTTDHRPDEKNVRTEVAVIKTCPSRFLGDGTPIALAAVHDGDFAEQTRNRAELGTLESLECSILGSGHTKAGKIDGQKANIVEAITKGQSVDWVTKGGAGGHAHSLAENDGGEVMSEQKKDEDKKVEETSEAQTKEVTLTENQQKQAQEQEEPQKLAEAEITKMLSETNLPSASKKRLAGGEYEDESALREAILAEVEYVKTLTGSGLPFAQGGQAQPKETKPLSERLDAVDARYGLREVQNA